MEWTEFSLGNTKRKVALHDPTYTRLSQRADKINKEILAVEKKGGSVSKKKALSLHAALSELMWYIKPYLNHAKRHHHRPDILVWPKSLKPYLKDDKLKGSLDI